MREEFGSDFHRIDNYPGKPNDLIKLNPITFANGRMAIISLINQRNWKRLWMPQYFCYEVIDAIKSTGINIMLYDDAPEADDNALINEIKFEEGDALFRMNYFALRSKRNNENIAVDVIEDHSHGLLTDWALNSNADYCIASLRKSIPIPEGGILWSTLGHKMQLPPKSSLENNELVYTRSMAMDLKNSYLGGDDIEKSSFLKLFKETEEAFEHLSVCDMSTYNKQLLSYFDYRTFDSRKKENWHRLTEHLNARVDYLQPENINNTPFSVVLKFDDSRKREFVKNELIKAKIYPAILWQIPAEYKTTSNSYLSLHCDGRYGKSDMISMANIINRIYNDARYQNL